MGLVVTTTSMHCFVFYNLFLFLAVLGLHCCAGFPLVATSRGCSLVAVLRLSIAAASLTEHRLHKSLGRVGCSSCSSRVLELRLIVVVPGFRCSSSCAIFPDQRPNLCLLHWQADSLPLSHHYHSLPLETQ